MAGTTRLPDVRNAREWLRSTSLVMAQAAESLAEAGYPAQAQSLKDERATLDDIAERAPLPRLTTSTITLDESAVAAHGEALTLIQAAHAWAQGADLAFALSADDLDRAERIVRERREKVAEMERSLANGLMHLMFCSQSHDGPIVLSRDGHACWFWRHPRSGYHGGLVFHPSHADGERLPVGTWSVHT